MSKKIILIAILFSSLLVSAQTSVVPSEVLKKTRSTAHAGYPTIKQYNWKQLNKNVYIASFLFNGKQETIYIDKNGNMNKDWEVILSLEGNKAELSK